MKKNKSNKLGYVRITSKQQDLGLQINALTDAGVEEKNLFIERLTGNLMRSDRPQLKLCLQHLQKGDTFVVWKFDRLGRSLPDLVAIALELHKKEVTFVSLTEKVDTSSPTGMLFFEMIGAFADFERNILSERTRAGREAARKRGVSGGRKNKLSTVQERVLVNMYKEGTLIRDLQSHFGISKTCVYRYLNKHKVVKLKQETQ